MRGQPTSFVVTAVQYCRNNAKMSGGWITREEGYIQKVVAAVWVTKFISFLAALANLR